MDDSWKETLKGWIKDWIASTGLNQSAFAEKAGIGQAQVSHLMTGKRDFTFNTVERSLLVLNKTYHDLFAKPIIQHLDYPLSIHVTSNNHSDILNGTADDYRGIPLYESGRLAAGPNGMAFDPYEEPSSIVVVYRPELQGCAHHNLAAMRVDGYSMEPTIAKGSIVVVDLSDKEHFDSRIYAINTPGGGIDMVSVKRVQKFKGGFSLISDNPQHPTVVSELDWDRLCVGRVVWMWKDVRES